MRKASLLFALALFIAVAPAMAANFDIDKAHTSIGFSVRHMVVSNTKGAFRDFAGTFAFDEKGNILSAADLSIKTESVDTGEPKRDEHLRSPDFFDAKTFPAITFKLKEAKTAGNKIKAKGDLTIHGVTKEVSLEGEFLGATTDPWGNHRVGFTAEGKVNRQDYGIKFNKVMDNGGVVVGDEVKILLEVEGIQQK